MYIYIFIYLDIYICIQLQWSFDLSAKVFDESARLLSTPHAAVGNGQHIPCATIALLAVLCSVELFPTATLTKSIGQTNQIVNVMADGRCFFSCCFLWSNGISEQRQWLEVVRNQCGFPTAVARMKHEDDVVREWFQEIVERHSPQRTDVKFAQKLDQLVEKFDNYVTPEHEDVEFFLGWLVRSWFLLVRMVTSIFLCKHWGAWSMKRFSCPIEQAKMVVDSSLPTSDLCFSHLPALVCLFQRHCVF